MGGLLLGNDAIIKYVNGAPTIFRNIENSDVSLRFENASGFIASLSVSSSGVLYYTKRDGTVVILT